MNEKAHQLLNLKKAHPNNEVLGALLALLPLLRMVWFFAMFFCLSLFLSFKLPHYVINTKLQTFKLALKPSANSNTNMKDEFTFKQIINNA